MKNVLPVLLAAASVAIPSSAQTQSKNSSSSQQSIAATLKVAPDLDQRLAKWRPVKMPFNASALTPKERSLVDKLVEASHYIEDIFWRQSDPEGLDLYLRLKGSTNPEDEKLRHLIFINGGRFDLLEDNQPFVGTQPMPPGRGFYPEGLTRQDIESYVKAHPDKKNEIYSGYTIVRRHSDQLEGVPYHVAYKDFLEPAAKALREAAALSEDPQFANFLRLRATALLDDNYYPSDLAWLDLKNPKFDIIFAPYETYLDDLLGVKTSYGGAVMIRNEEQSAKLAVYQKYVPDIQEALPLDRADLPSKRGLQSPMEVMDTPFRAGDLRHGYQAVADNLPNDPRIHEQKGSKKIFFKNYMDARVQYIILPVAKLVMRPDQAAKVSGEGYMASTLMHEISHGLGPAYARTASGKVDIREAIGPAYGGLEEAKADVVGMFGLKWLVDHGALPKARLEEYYASYVGGIFRTARFGVGEAHGRAEMMEFNYYFDHNAITRDQSGRYVVNYARMPAVIADLARELLQMEATGNRARVEQWFQKYDVIPTDLKTSLDKASNVPVDIDPIFSFPEPIE
ncbi:MAG TPA: Zn-dependent hydrolase [Terriglobales bacterium]|nr:Zn-dependent hydrolase [Terriglobales bacterium]